MEKLIHNEETLASSLIMIEHKRSLIQRKLSGERKAIQLDWLLQDTIGIVQAILDKKASDDLDFNG